MYLTKEQYEIQHQSAIKDIKQLKSKFEDDDFIKFMIEVVKVATHRDVTKERIEEMLIECPNYLCTYILIYKNERKINA